MAWGVRERKIKGKRGKSCIFFNRFQLKKSNPLTTIQLQPKNFSKLNSTQLNSTHQFQPKFMISPRHTSSPSIKSHLSNFSALKKTYNRHNAHHTSKTLSLSFSTSTKSNPTLLASKSFVALADAFEFLLASPLKKLKKRRDSVLRVCAALKSDYRVIGNRDVGTRRAIAIQRVLEDTDERSARDYFLFRTARNDELFVQSWTPVSASIKGLVIILHGLNEHSGRYTDFAKQLNADGYRVYGMDWIGHGGSDGLHGYVHSLDNVIGDVKAFLEKILSENPGIPCFCFGHSTGGAIVLKAVMDPTIGNLIKGVVLTSPAVRVRPSHPIFWVIAPIFALLLPKYQFSSATKRGVPVSRDPEALIAKYSDPLVYIGSIRVRTGSEILGLSNYLQQNLSRLTVPLLVLHGTADTVTDPTASQKLYEEASSTDKSIKLYDDHLHDLLFELEWKTIAKDIVHWLNCRQNV